MGISGFLGSGLAGKHAHQWRLPLHQTLQSGLHVVQGFEAIHALGTPTKLTRRLRSTQQKDANQSNFPTIKIKNFLEPVFVFSYAAVGAASWASQAFFL